MVLHDISTSWGLSINTKQDSFELMRQYILVKVHLNEIIL